MENLLQTLKTVQTDVKRALDRDREIMRHSDIKFDEGYLRAMSYVISKIEEMNESEN